MWHDVKNNSFPEKMMWLGVMRRAIFDYVLYRGCGPWSLECRLASQFIFVDDTKYEGGLNCEEVCGLFGWDVEYIRSLVKKLSRADIRKLESSKFKEEFLVDYLSVIVESFVRWSTFPGLVTPFLTNRRYAPEYRELFRLKTIPNSEMPRAKPSVVRWLAAA